MGVVKSDGCEGGKTTARGKEHTQWTAGGKI